MKGFYALLVLLLPVLLAAQDDDYMDHPMLRYADVIYRDDISTVQLHPLDDKLGIPATDLNGGIPLILEFDHLAEEIKDFSYYLVHCDAQWRPSDLETSQYLEGFASQRISNVEYSFNTITDFLHYKLAFPDDMMKPRYSGNYLIVVYENDDPQQVVLSRRLVVYENLVTVNPVVHQSSVIAHHLTHQEVDFNIFHKSYPIRYPETDLHVTILQNGDWSHAINDLKPRFVKTEELSYDHMGTNEFPGNSEYREFDTKSDMYQSIEIESMFWGQPENLIFLQLDEPPRSKVYSTDRDLNGRFFIQNDRGMEPELDADYHKTFFKLTGPEKPGYDIYITGQFSNWDCLNKYKLKWDETKQEYTLEAFFKQGYYNYRYETVNAFDKKTSAQMYEGSFYQTENEYIIIVYNRDIANDYDRVIAFRVANSRQ